MLYTPYTSLSVTHEHLSHFAVLAMDFSFDVGSKEQALDFGSFDFGQPDDSAVAYPKAPKSLLSSGLDGKKKANKRPLSAHGLHELVDKPVHLHASDVKQIESKASNKKPPSDRQPYSDGAVRDGGSIAAEAAAKQQQSAKGAQRKAKNGTARDDGGELGHATGLTIADGPGTQPGVPEGPPAPAKAQDSARQQKQKTNDRDDLVGKGVKHEQQEERRQMQAQKPKRAEVQAVAEAAEGLARPQPVKPSTAAAAPRDAPAEPEPEPELHPKKKAKVQQQQQQQPLADGRDQQRVQKGKAVPPTQADGDVEHQGQQQQQQQQQQQPQRPRQEAQKHERGSGVLEGLQGGPEAQAPADTSAKGAGGKAASGGAAAADGSGPVPRKGSREARQQQHQQQLKEAGKQQQGSAMVLAGQGAEKKAARQQQGKGKAEAGAPERPGDGGKGVLDAVTGSEGPRKKQKKGHQGGGEEGGAAGVAGAAAAAGKQLVGGADKATIAKGKQRQDQQQQRGATADGGRTTAAGVPTLAATDAAAKPPTAQSAASLAAALRGGKLGSGGATGQGATPAPTLPAASGAPAAGPAAGAKKLTHAEALAAMQRKQAAAAAAVVTTVVSADDDADGGGAGGRGVGLGKAKGSVKGLGADAGGGFLSRLRDKLAGGRFRHLNEELYTRSGGDAYRMMQREPELFSQYHDGWKRQIGSWPKKPVDVAIAWLKKHKSEVKEVADFGCGDAKIAASVPQVVHSFDLVANAPGVVACNMAHVPLGSAAVDAAVFSLALMGTDYGSFLEEAVRVLKPKGWLWIAEVRSRFVSGGRQEGGEADEEDEQGSDGEGAAAAGGGGGGGGGGQEDFRPFLSCLARLGLKLQSQDVSNRMFVVWVLRKGADKEGGKGGANGKAGAIPWPPLKACVYKKR